jgi:hypothetical protein
MADIIIGNQLTNLTPDGPNYQTIDGNQVGAATGKQVTERYQIIRANAAASIVAFGTAHATETDCLLRAFRRILDTTGALTKIDLIYRNPSWESSTINIGSGEELVEMDQTLTEVPLERASYFSTLTPDQLFEVNEILSAGHFVGRDQDDTHDLGYNSSTLFYYETPNASQRYELHSLSDPLQIELLLERIKGRDYVLRPAPVLRITTGANPNFATIMNDSGKKKHPGYSLPGTAANWLVNCPRAERRRSNGNTFYQTVKEYIYNPDGWDIDSGNKLYQTAS